MTTFNVTPATFTGATTLQSMVTAGAAGDTYNFAPGIYRNQYVSTPKNTLHFNGPANPLIAGPAVFSGSVIIDGWSIAYATGTTTLGAWTSNTTFTRVTPQSNNQAVGSLAQFGEEVFFDGARLIPTLTNPPPAGQWFWNSGKIVISQSPVGHLVELAQTIAFFNGGSGVSGETMQDITVQQYANNAFGSEPFGVIRCGASSTYTRVIIQDCHAGGFRWPLGSTGVTITNCKMLRCGSEGYSSSQGSGNMTGCEIAYNGNADFDLMNEGGVGKLTTSTTGTFANNYVHDNYGIGPWWDAQASSQICKGNLVVENWMSGIQYEICSTGTFDRNVCVRNGLSWKFPLSNNPYFASALGLYNAASCTVSNNFIEVAPNGGSALVLAHDSTRSAVNSNNNTWSGNTVVFFDTTARNGLWQYQTTTVNPGYTETWTNNKYYSASTSDAHWSTWAQGAFGNNTVITFAQWQALGYDTSGSGSSLSTTAWNPMKIIASSNGGESLINTTDAPVSIWGGWTGETIDPGAFAWPSHIWVGPGTNTLIIRIGTGNTTLGGVTVHDWVSGGGTNNIVLVGYSFASAAVAVAAIVNSGSNTVLTLTDSKTVTFLDATAAAFSTANVSIALAAPADTRQNIAGVLNLLRDGQAQGAIVPGAVRQAMVSAFDQGTGPPTSGTYSTGARILNSAPVVLGSVGSQYIIDGWRCTAGGTPGTWVQTIAYTGS